MELIAFDLETTGVDPFTDVPVSYTLGDTTALINPGRPIPEGASKIHGITDDMVVNAECLQYSIFAIHNALVSYWALGKTIIGMNVSYDLTMVDSVLRTYGASLKVGSVLDVLVIDRTFDKYRKGSRTLSSLCTHYGVVLENAHTSSADANACIEIFDKQLKMYAPLRYLVNFDKLRNDTMAALYVEWLTHYSEYLVKQGKDPIPKGRYRWPIHTQEI